VPESIGPTLRADLLRYCDPGARYQDTAWSWATVLKALVSEQGVWAILDYRFRRWGRELPGPGRRLAAIVGFASRKLVETLTGIQIAGSADFGPGLFIGHFGGIIVGEGLVVGENCNLSHNVTLGAHRGSPRIGMCCFLGPGARVFGPITIGDHVAIGANAVINEDVPSFSTAVAGRAEILEGRGNLVPGEASD
jgi:serine O-acetyltransferase